MVNNPREAIRQQLSQISPQEYFPLAQRACLLGIQKSDFIDEEAPSVALQNVASNRITPDYQRYFSGYTAGTDEQYLVGHGWQQEGKPVDDELVTAQFERALVTMAVNELVQGIDPSTGEFDGDIDKLTEIFYNLGSTDFGSELLARVLPGLNLK
ncbi:hypothetical protein A2783_04270 [Microgenomates group bacterium RIFCSPHIGHO2_01_FULL_45_11]|nr:MAG: hypothetical protein A2783_04270 [Microgenomates group bacterium RIFCSPHIGHO2_01_FULL_45_11]